MQNNEITLNDGHIHEALDRIHVAIDYLHVSLKDHSLLAGVSELEFQVDNAIEILADLYQLVGSFDSIKDIQSKFYLKPGYVNEEK